MKLLAILAFALLGFPAHAVEDARGCYAVRTVVTLNGVATSIEERSIRLTSERNSSPLSRKGFKVVPAAAAEPFSYSSAYWFEDKPNIIVVFTDNGLSGLRLALHRSSEGLEGVMDRYWDFQDPTDERKVHLTRKPCESFH